MDYARIYFIIGKKRSRKLRVISPEFHPSRVSPLFEFNQRTSRRRMEKENRMERSREMPDLVLYIARTFVPVSGIIQRMRLLKSFLAILAGLNPALLFFHKTSLRPLFFFAYLYYYVCVHTYADIADVYVCLYIFVLYSIRLDDR